MQQSRSLHGAMSWGVLAFGVSPYTIQQRIDWIANPSLDSKTLGTVPGYNAVFMAESWILWT
jgi:hypothetical protein